MNILITGSTGFLGNEITKQILKDFDKIYLLIRNPDKLDKSLLSKTSNLILIQGDITERQIFSKKEDRTIILKDVDVILHTAALYDLQADATQCYLTNIIGTFNLLTFASQIKKLKYFHHLSTIAVKGDLGGDLYENVEQIPKVKYSNNYAQTKMSAELLVRKSNFTHAKVRIYRPGIVVGDSNTGRINRIDGPYYFLKFLSGNSFITQLIKKLPFILFPFNPHTILPLIPVNMVCDWIAHMLINPQGDEPIKIYNLVTEKNPTVKEFLEACKNEFNLTGNFKPFDAFQSTFKAFAPKLDIPSEIIPYMNDQGGYLIDNRLKDYPELKDNFLFKNYQKKFFKGFNDFIKSEKNK